MAWVLIPILWLLIFLLTWMLFRRGRLGTPWHLDVAALGLLVLATLGFFWRVVVGQSWMPADGGDLASFLFPTYRFAAGTLRGGDWPLWNPYVYMGTSHVGDIQAGFLYPPNLLLFLLGGDFPYTVLQWLSMGHIWFAGAGMYLLLVRGLRIGRVPALAGAIAFMFADSFLVHFGNLNLNAVASWLPWVFWAYLIALRKGSLGWAALSGLLLAVATLAGHIQTTLFIILALAIYTAIWLWLYREDAAPTADWERPIGVTLSGSSPNAARLGQESEESRSAGHGDSSLDARPVASWPTDPLRVTSSGGERLSSGARRAGLAAGAWLVCVLLTCLLTAPVLLPSVQLAGLTGRAGWNYQEAAGYSLSPAQWIGWLVPGFFGRGPQLHWGAWPRVETGYIGVLTLILAGLALVLRRDRRTWSWAGLAGASFILSLGIYAIPHGWLTLLPGFGQFRAPARLLLVTDFSLAILAAIGLEAALQPFTHPARAAFERAWRGVAFATAGVALVVVPLVYLAFLFIQDREQTLLVSASLTLGAVMAFAGLLAASLLWLTARRGGWGKPRTLAWLAVALILLDVASLGAYVDLGNEDPSTGFRQPAITGFLASQPAPFRIDTRTGLGELWQPDTALLYGLEDVTGVANPSKLADSARYWEELGSRSSRLYDLLNARYVIAKKDAPLDWDKFSLAFDGDPNLNVYENRQVLPRAFIVGQIRSVPDHEAAWDAIHAPEFDPGVSAVVEGAAPQSGGSGEVSEIRSEPDRVTMTAAAHGPALLVISQVWYSGWQAWVDGAPAGEPLRTDYLFQGIPLDDGVHQVELRFVPPLWRLGWVLAGLALLVLAVLVVIGILRRARRKT
jgi:hypothetical protein